MVSASDRSSVKAHAYALHQDSSPAPHDELEAIMRRNNQRLYRVARSVLHNDADAEEILQEVYLTAFSNWPSEQPHDVSAWLTSVTFRRSIDRLRANVRRRRLGREVPNGGITTPASDPERQASRLDLLRRIEHAVEALPLGLRLVFVLRDIQGMSGADTAGALRIAEPAVRVRLNRARARLRAALGAATFADVTRTFEFGSTRCDRLVAEVGTRFRAAEPRSESTRHPMTDGHQ